VSAVCVAVRVAVCVAVRVAVCVTVGAAMPMLFLCQSQVWCSVVQCVAVCCNVRAPRSLVV